LMAFFHYIIDLSIAPCRSMSLESATECPKIVPSGAEAASPEPSSPSPSKGDDDDKMR
jgi:hypothetical protein